MTLQPPARSRAGLLLEQLEQLKEEPLSVIDARLSVTVADEIALADAKIRRHIAYALMIVFTLVNFMTLLFFFFSSRRTKATLPRN